MTVVRIALDVDLTAEPPREVRTLLADARRKLVLITLRKGTVLAAHRALHPITIQCVAGSGALVVGDETVALSSGVVVPLDAGVEHEVRSEAVGVAVLVTFFRAPENGA